jgi:hypothetical protein
MIVVMMVFIIEVVNINEDYTRMSHISCMLHPCLEFGLHVNWGLCSAHTGRN